jgi:hypothetical protein
MWICALGLWREKMSRRRPDLLRLGVGLERRGQLLGRLHCDCLELC